MHFSFAFTGNLINGNVDDTTPVTRKKKKVWVTKIFLDKP